MNHDFTKFTTTINWCRPLVLAKGRPKLPATPFADIQDWVYSGNQFHPTEKSVEIIAPLIRAFSKPGDIILDPFLGSGTTAVAAALSGRSYIGIELEQKYYDLALRRLEGVKRFYKSKDSRKSPAHHHPLNQAA